MADGDVAEDGASAGGASDDWTRVEFLDPDEAAPDDVLWADEEGVGAGRDPSRLPPRATARRVLASLVALGVFLAGTGSAAAAAYHRHMTDRRLANELVLRAASSPPAIPDLAALGFAAEWHAQVTERVLVPVVNQGPKTVTLLGAVLAEPGLVADVPLTPVVGRTLRPGGTAELAGTVTADCTQGQGAAAAGGAAPVLTVRARTAGGTTATARIDPEGEESPGLQQRICGQEGDRLTEPGALTTSIDTTSHIITLRLTAASNADVRLGYTPSGQYESDPSLEVPGLVLSRPLADPPNDSLAAHGTLTATYYVGVRTCPSAKPRQPTMLDLQLRFSVGGATLSSTTRQVDLDPLIATACPIGR